MGSCSAHHLAAEADAEVVADAVYNHEEDIHN